MKSILLFLLTVSILKSAPLTLTLKYDESEKVNYALQIQTQFTKLLSTNASLAKKFTRFESPPPEYARGRYDGVPIIRTIVISKKEHVNFNNAGGTKELEQVIAFYYRFDEGMHRGRATSSGFFALFAVKGKMKYKHIVNDNFDLIDSLVTAKFLGFSRTLKAPSPEEQ